MKVLDCETVESIYSSFEEFLAVDSTTLREFLKRIEDDDLYPNNRSPEDVLLEKTQKEFHTTCDVDAIYWFHLTRTVRNNNFEQGILPLGQAIAGIWDTLYSLVKESITFENWQDFKTKVENQKLNHSTYLYQMKVKDCRHWGPYATLIRDFAFFADKLPIHDYLRTPEIVEDICICFEEIYQIDLLRLFQEASSPCIVKFVDYEDRQDAISTALLYLHTIIHGSEVSIWCNTNLDREGQGVPKDRIQKIEFLSQ